VRDPTEIHIYADDLTTAETAALVGVSPEVIRVGSTAATSCRRRGTNTGDPATRHSTWQRPKPRPVDTHAADRDDERMNLYECPATITAAGADPVLVTVSLFASEAVRSGLG
jgi:hypothetical protein